MIYLVYAILCLIWGSTWLAIKIGLDDASPFWLAAFRFLIASVLLLVVNAFRPVKFPRSLREWIKIGIPGLFMYAGSYLAVYWSEVYIDSALTAVIFASLPFFVAAFSVIMIPEERLKPVGWVGLIVGFSGIVLIFNDTLRQADFIFWGAFLSFLGASSSAFGTVYIRARLKEYDISMMASVQMAIGAVIITMVAFAFESLANFAITPKTVFSVAYLILFGTIGAFLGYYWLLKRNKTIHVSLIAFVTPLIALIIGSLFRGESFSTLTAVGTALILGGILLVVRK